MPLCGVTVVTVRSRGVSAWINFLFKDVIGSSGHDGTDLRTRFIVSLRSLLGWHYYITYRDRGDPTKGNPV